MVRIFIFIVLFILGSAIFWQLFISVGFKQSTTCFDIEAQLSQEFYQEASLMPEGLERNQLVCDDSAASMSRLEQCLIKSSEDHKLSFRIYSALPQFKRTIADTVQIHNLNCPGSQISSPSFR